MYAKCETLIRRLNPLSITWNMTDVIFQGVEVAWHTLKVSEISFTQRNQWPYKVSSLLSRGKFLIQNYLSFPNDSQKSQKHRTLKACCQFIPVFEPGFDPLGKNVSNRTFAPLRPITDYKRNQFAVPNLKHKFAELLSILIDKAIFNSKDNTEVLTRIFEAMENFIGLEDMESKNKTNKLLFHLDWLAYDAAKPLISFYQSDGPFIPCPNVQERFPCNHPNLVKEQNQYCKDYCNWVKSPEQPAQVVKFNKIMEYASGLSGEFEEGNPVSLLSLCQGYSGNLTWDCWDHVITANGPCFTASIRLNIKIFV